MGAHGPTPHRRIRGDAPNAIVIGPGHALDLGAIGGDCLATAFADRFRDIDHASAAEGVSAPGDRTPMIAIGRASHRDVRGQISVTPRREVERRCDDVLLLPDRFAQQLEYRVRATQRLEAANTY